MKHSSFKRKEAEIETYTLGKEIKDKNIIINKLEELKEKKRATGHYITEAYGGS